MSTIKIELTVDVNNIEIVTEFLSRISAQTKGVKEVKVNDAEEVKAESPKKAPAKPAAKKAPVKAPVEETEEEEEETFEEEEEETITLEDVKAMQAKKVAANRDAIIKKLNALGATKLSELDEDSYQTYYDFLAKLK